MSDIDRIVQIHRDHRAVTIDPTAGEGDIIECYCGWWYTVDDHASHVAQVIDAALRPVIENIEELDALPPDSVVRGRTGMPWHKDDAAWWPASISGVGRDASLISLPARVLYMPEVD
ncbi:hypothetical protein BTO20_11345 [Mycobacterium dioxanotrophicus]|uniref:Uncharacterized protein n=1 Tax=Mycobacterium dioxanotrophicus TaxID=482462 RepID=A0A1Y0C1N8_9MYCO|nr:hypothetical protein [Mycobacterium dioxanotrophicus]ART69099.1 hypothetical protein BTO20_11345 [Mycobacterium dioxanotrophicus]